MNAALEYLLDNRLILPLHDYLCQLSETIFYNINQ